MSQEAADAGANALKEVANAHFTAKRFKAAEETYTDAINRFTAVVSPLVGCTLHVNRAECYLNLSKDPIFLHMSGDNLNNLFHRVLSSDKPDLAAEDCKYALSHEQTLNRPEGSHIIFNKAHFRLSKSYAALGREREATVEMQNFLRLNQLTAPPNPPSNVNTSGLQPIDVLVFVTGDTPQTPFRIQETIPPILLTPHPPRGLARQYLTALVSRCDPLVMSKKAWNCWSCSKPATSLTHSPMIHDKATPPIIADHIQPVCLRGGPCDRKAQHEIANIIAEMNVPPA